MVLSPEMDTVIDRSHWRPPFYGSTPTPEEYGLSQRQIAQWPAKEKRLREQRTKKAFKIFCWVFISPTILVIALGIITQSDIISIVFVILTMSITVGLFLALAISARYLPLDGERLKDKEFEPYYAYLCAVSYYEYWKRKQNIQYLLGLSGLDFEYAVATIMTRLGYSATVTQASGDGGIDIIVSYQGMKFPIQCKNKAKPQGPDVIREFIGAMTIQYYDYGAIIASNGFTKGSIELAQDHNIELLDMNWLTNPRIFT